jgi:hypothetical protein
VPPIAFKSEFIGEASCFQPARSTNKKVKMAEVLAVEKKPPFVNDMDDDFEDAPAMNATAVAVNANIQSWGADDEDDVSGSILKSGGLPYVKVSANQPARIAFVPGAKIFGCPVHYEGVNKKYYLCDSKTGVQAKCCKKFGDPKGRAAAFVFEYTNADPKSGKMQAGTVPMVQVSIFTMSRSNWEDVKGAVEEGSKVDSADYKISVTEGQLTRKVSVVARVARWREIEKQAMELAAPFLANPEQLQRALGRPFTGSVNIPDPSMDDVKTL